MARRQFGKPFVLTGDESADSAPQALQRINIQDKSNEGFNEGWLRDVIFKCPELIPILEIEAAFSPLVPVCRELPTPAGPIDALFVNSDGMLTVVECKLWRNPEARREVIGQILDYAKELSRWSYEDLQESIGRATRSRGNVLYEIVRKSEDDISEAEFVDNVTRNLKRGRFLLIILGDGIRESVENITNYLQVHSGLHFTFALVEMAVFGFPAGSEYRYLFQPRVITRTIEIERAVIRVENGVVIVEAPQNTVVTYKQLGRRVKPTDEEFYEALSAVDKESARLLPNFFDRCQEIGLEAGRGTSSRMLHWYSDDFGKINFGSIFKDGTVNTNYICSSAEAAGDLSIGERYLQQLADLLDGYEVKKDGKSWNWRVCKGKSYPSIRECLAVQEKWMALIENTMQAFLKLND